MKSSLRGLLVLAVVWGGSLAASAGGAILEIQFTGMDLVYDGQDLFDAGGSNTARGFRIPHADPLQSMVFLVDGVQVGSMLTSDIFLDTYIKGVSIPVGPSLIPSGGNGGDFGVDLLMGGQSGSDGLGLQIDQLQVFYSGAKIAIAAAGFSTGVFAQQLPFGLAFDPGQPITIVLSSANLTNVTTNGTVVTGLHASGTGSITGIVVPEPGPLALVSLSGLGLVWRRRW